MLGKIQANTQKYGSSVGKKHWKAVMIKWLIVGSDLDMNRDLSKIMRVISNNDNCMIMGYFCFSYVDWKIKTTNNGRAWIFLDKIAERFLITGPKKGDSILDEALISNWNFNEDDHGI